MGNELTKESARLLLGLKIKKYRQKQGLSLSDLAQRAGVSVSYLSEIEKGKKYPKLEKLFSLSESLGISYNDLAMLDLDDKDFNVFHTSMFDSFPFQQFGITKQDVLEIVNQSDNNMSAFIRTLYEVVQMYDTQVDFFLITALRSLQKLHRNYFDQLEAYAIDFKQKYRSFFSKKTSLSDSFQTILKECYGYTIEDIAIDVQKDLGIFRSIYVNGDRNTLFLNKELSDLQKQFIFAKELGFRFLELKKRPMTSPDIEMDDFDCILSNFQATYFAGALLMPKVNVEKDLKRVFGKSHWKADSFWNLVESYHVTPETFFHRISQLLPTLFGIDQLYFLRLHHRCQSDRFLMTKELNFTEDFTPDYFRNEHYCRRWTPIRLLKQFNDTTSPYTLIAEKVRKVGTEKTYFNISYVHPSSIRKGTNVSFTIGFLIDETSMQHVKFLNDASLEIMEVHETCERCPLSESECGDRVAPAHMHSVLAEKKELKTRLQDFIDKL